MTTSNECLEFLKCNSDVSFVPFYNRGRKVGPTTNKVLATVFWNTQGINHIDYLRKGNTVRGDLCVNLLGRFNDDLRKKSVLSTKNGRVNTSVVIMAKIDELGCELHPHPPYSPDLAPSNSFSIPNLKKSLDGMIFRSNACFEDYEKSYYFEGSKKF